MDKILFYCALILIVIGLVMVYSSSSVMAQSRFGSHLYFLQRQIIWLVIACLAAWGVLKLDLKKNAAYSVPLLFLTLLLLMVVFIMPARNGSHRWIFLGPLTIQPSEIFKMMIIYYLAFSLSQKKRELENLKQILLPYAPLIGAGLILIILEPGLGSALTITLTVLTIFFLAGIRLYHLSLLILPLAGLASFMVFILGYKKDRVIDYLSAIADPLLGSYQIKQAVLTLGAGNIFGAGLGNGRQKLFFLPYPHTDFIFASIGEEFGFIGLVIILSLFYIIIWRGIKIALYQPDRFGYLLAMGMTVSLSVAVLINMGVVTSLLPTTGIPLPLLSYGGSALLGSIAAIAVLLNLSKRKGMMIR
ncbi:MAG: putative lipid II flippase FtsW [candidate division Zixibacteria bacterium]|nr:putative lipid II flippase FtsW [candidate division Zixibacteria bacterium]